MRDLVTTIYEVFLKQVKMSKEYWALKINGPYQNKLGFTSNKLVLG